MYVYILPDPIQYVNRLMLKYSRASPADVPFGGWYLIGAKIFTRPFSSGENASANRDE